MRLYAHTKIEQKAYERNKKATAKIKRISAINWSMIKKRHKYMNKSLKEQKRKMLKTKSFTQKAIYITIDDGRRA